MILLTLVLHYVCSKDIQRLFMIKRICWDDGAEGKPDLFDSGAKDPADKQPRSDVGGRPKRR